MKPPEFLAVLLVVFAATSVVSGSVTFGSDCTDITSKAEDWTPSVPTLHCWDAFLSYRRCDVCSEASYLHSQFLKKGVTSFLYQHHRAPTSQLYRAVADSRVLLLLLSESALQSQWTNLELSTAIQYGMDICVVLPAANRRSGPPVHDQQGQDHWAAVGCGADGTSTRSSTSSTSNSRSNTSNISSSSRAARGLMLVQPSRAPKWEPSARLRERAITIPGPGDSAEADGCGPRRLLLVHGPHRAASVRVLAARQLLAEGLQACGGGGREVPGQHPGRCLGPGAGPGGFSLPWDLMDSCPAFFVQ